jgi:hypothetical protein
VAQIERQPRAMASSIGANRRLEGDGGDRRADVRGDEGAVQPGLRRRARIVRGGVLHIVGMAENARDRRHRRQGVRALPASARKGKRER